MRLMKQRKLRIGFFIDTFYPNIDGVVKVVDNYASRLSETCEVIVFAPEGRGKFDDSVLPYKVERAHMLRLFYFEYDLPMPDLDREFKKRLEKSELDIVHVHSPFAIGRAGLRYARKHKIPCIGHMHSQFRQDFERQVPPSVLKNTIIKYMMWRLRRFFDSTTENWTVNAEVARIFHEDYGVRTLPRIMPNGTDMKTLNVDPSEVRVLREKYGVAEGERILLFVGRINKLKNVDFLVRSFGLLKQKGFAFKALLIGKGQDGDSIKKLIKKLELSDCVFMPGTIEDRRELAAHYSLADLFTFPSLYDANSLVQIEAASRHTPSLFLEGSATSSSIKPGIDGYVSDRSEEAYADKIVEIFSDPKQYADVCRRAYEDLALSWDEIVVAALSRYRELV